MQGIPANSITIYLAFKFVYIPTDAYIYDSMRRLFFWHIIAVITMQLEVHDDDKRCHI